MRGRVGFFGFCFRFMRAATAAAVFVFLLARTAPDKKDRHTQDGHQRKKFLPFHVANIAAIANRANGNFYLKILLLLVLVLVLEKAIRGRGRERGGAVATKNFELSTPHPKLE